MLFIPTYGYMASAWATMIVYALQMVLSYYLGQKYYPIKYNLRKFFLYLGVALLVLFHRLCASYARTFWTVLRAQYVNHCLNWNGLHLGKVRLQKSLGLC